MTGVAYIFNPLLHNDGLRDTSIVRATKLILVSSGTFGSPGILERPGIGAKDVLERVGVKQRIDLPGVGQNYQNLPIQFPSQMFWFLTFWNSFADHDLLTSQYFAADEAQAAQSLDAILRNEEGAIDGVSRLSCLTTHLGMLYD